MASPIPNCSNCGGNSVMYVRQCPGESMAVTGGVGGGGGGISALKDLEKIPICYVAGTPTPPPSSIPLNVAGATRTIIPVTTDGQFSTGSGTSYTPTAGEQLRAVKFYSTAPIGSQRRIEVWEGGTAPGTGTQVYTVDEAWTNDPDGSWTHTFPTPIPMTAGTAYYITFRSSSTAAGALVVPVVYGNNIRPEGNQFILASASPVWSPAVQADLIGDLMFGAAPTAPTPGGGTGGAGTLSSPFHGFLVERWNALTGAFESREIQDLTGAVVTGVTIVQCVGASNGNRPDLEPICYSQPNTAGTRPGFLVVSYDTNGTEVSRTVQDASGSPLTDATIVSCNGASRDIERTAICYSEATPGVPSLLTLSSTGAEGLVVNDSGLSGFAQVWRFPNNQMLTQVVSELSSDTTGTTAVFRLRSGSDPNTGAILFTSPAQTVQTTLAPLTWAVPNIEFTANSDYVAQIMFTGPSGAVVQVSSEITSGNPLNGRSYERNSSLAGQIGNWLPLNPDNDFSWDASFVSIASRSSPQRGFLVVSYDSGSSTGEEVSRRIEKADGSIVANSTIVDCPVPPTLDGERTEICYSTSQPPTPINLSVAGDTTRVANSGNSAWLSGFAQQYQFPEARTLTAVTAESFTGATGMPARVLVREGTDPSAGNILATSDTVPIPQSDILGAMIFTFPSPASLNANQTYTLVYEIDATGQTGQTVDTEWSSTGNPLLLQGFTRDERGAWTGQAPGGFSWDLAMVLGAATPPSQKGFLVVFTNHSNGSEHSRRIEDRAGVVQAGASIVDCPTDAPTTTPTQAGVDVERVAICYQPTEPPAPINTIVSATENTTTTGPGHTAPVPFVSQSLSPSQKIRVQSIEWTLRTAQGLAVGQVKIYKPAGGDPTQGELIATSNQQALASGTTVAARTFTFSPAPVLEANTGYSFVLETVDGNTNNTLVVSMTPTPIGGWAAQENENAAGTWTTLTGSFAINIVATQFIAPEPGYLVVIHNATDGTEISRRIETPAGTAVVPAPLLTDCPQPTTAVSSTPPTTRETDVAITLSEITQGNSIVIPAPFVSLSIAVVDDRVTINGVNFNEGDVVDLPALENRVYNDPVTVAHTGNSNDSRVRIVRVF